MKLCEFSLKEFPLNFIPYNRYSLSDDWTNHSLKQVHYHIIWLPWIRDWKSHLGWHCLLGLQHYLPWSCDRLQCLFFKKNSFFFEEALKLFHRAPSLKQFPDVLFKHMQPLGSLFLLFHNASEVTYKNSIILKHRMQTSWMTPKISCNYLCSSNHVLLVVAMWSGRQL